MDPALQTVLAEYERRSDQERQLMKTLSPAEIASRIDEFLICIGPDTAKLLHLIVTAARSQAPVELGASYGYSACPARSTISMSPAWTSSTRSCRRARSWRLIT